MNEKNNYKVYKIIMLVILTAFITFLITSTIMYQDFEKSNKGKFTSSFSKETDTTNIDAKIEKLKKIINQYYLNEVDEEALEEGAIKGYIEGLDDPYSEYISAKDMEDYRNSILGNFEGIGVYIIKDKDTNRIQVLSPIKNSPAEKAGILPGDFIIKVNDVEYTGDDLTTAANQIKGQEGTEVNLEILRGEETLKFEINRESIKINPVEIEKLENNIGYIEVTSFDEGTAKEFKSKYEELAKQNINSLIIDLRNNGGGIVDEALEIAEYIVDKDETLLITVDKNNNEEVKKSSKNPIINIPIVVLVNENTASASEILSGALKDLKRATLVGTKTYGKGVIQQLMTLTDGSGLKITTEEYYTPNRNKINKIGIEPDEIVELPNTVKNILSVEKDQDTQLNKAIELLKK